MDIQIQKEATDRQIPHSAFTIRIKTRGWTRTPHHRMLVIETGKPICGDKWLSDALKAGSNNKYGSLLVGVSLEDDTRYSDVKDSMLVLCIGSHRLIYHLPEEGKGQPRVPKALRTFFSDHRMLAAGMDIAAVSKRLYEDYGVKVENPVDLNKLAIKGLTAINVLNEGDDMFLSKYNLDRLAITAIGTGQVNRPKNPVRWYENRYYQGLKELREEKVKYAATDSYLWYLVGSKMIDLMKGTYPEIKRKKKKKNRKKKY